MRTSGRARRLTAGVMLGVVAVAIGCFAFGPSSLCPTESPSPSASEAPIETGRQDLFGRPTSVASRLLRATTAFPGSGNWSGGAREGILGMERVQEELAQRASDRWLADGELEARVASSDVVLVGEFHGLRAGPRAVLGLAGMLPNTRASGLRHGLFLEYFSVEDQPLVSRVELLAGDERRRLVEAELSQRSGGSIAHYAEMLCSGGIGAYALYGSGPPNLWRFEWPAELADADREPRLARQSNAGAVPIMWRGERRFDSSQERIVASVQAWLNARRPSQKAVVFVGVGHLLGVRTGLRDRFRGLGLKVLTLASFVPSWSVEILRRHGDETALLRTYQVSEDVLLLAPATLEELGSDADRFLRSWERDESHGPRR